MRSPELDAAVTIFRQTRPTMLAMPLDEQRVAYDAMAVIYPPSEDAEVRSVDAAGVPAELVTAAGARSDIAVLHLHGGGYGIGSPGGYRGWAARLSSASGASVLVPAYRLAPEAPFPAALLDARRAYGWLVEEVGDPERVAVSGDSAGGGLAVALLAVADVADLADVADAAVPGHIGEPEAGRPPMPSGLVLWSPWVDLVVGDDRADGVDDPVLSVAWLQERAARYLLGGDPAHSGASPVRAELTGLPPMLVLVGSDEILLPDARRIVERAVAAGVEAALWELSGAVHLWPHFAPLAPESKAAMRMGGCFLASRLGTAHSA